MQQNKKLYITEWNMTFDIWRREKVEGCID